MLQGSFRLIRNLPVTACLCVLGLLATAALGVLASRPRPVDPVLYSLPQLAVKASFPKWGGVLDRSWALDAGASKLCREQLGQACNLATWGRFLESQRDQPFPDRIAAINAFVNKVAYHDDLTVWGAKDYWAAPGEFFARGGDCEDYAIAKYMSLRALGVPAERMSIVVLQDTRRKLPHAVLSVRWAGPDLVLDNLSNDVRVWPELPHYQPIYSVNENGYEIVRSPLLPELLQSAGS